MAGCEMEGGLSGHLSLVFRGAFVNAPSRIMRGTLASAPYEPPSLTRCVPLCIIEGADDAGDYAWLLWLGDESRCGFIVTKRHNAMFA